ncbi:hypothetical protein [Desulfobacter sp.]|uniref:hypothetical protein n=1 Tax=Desulfobacter sp. TaxID=2294 RepID=UPI003D14B5C5
MTKIAIRIVGIGLLHSFLYGYLVPFVIYPRFGQHGITFAVILAILISIGIMATLWVGKNKKKKKGD